MAETPFSPESGAASGGTAPEDGSQGSGSQPEAGFVPPTPQPEGLATEPPLPAEPVVASAPASEPPEPATAEIADVVSTPEPPAEPAPQPPGVAATIAVPPLEGSDHAGGGEWDLLVERLSTWWNSGELGRQWQRIRGPLKGVAILVAVLLALQVYATVVSTIDSIPLVSGLLELTGLIAVLQFGGTRLLRSSDRQQVFSQLQRRWQDFRGRD